VHDAAGNATTDNKEANPNTRYDTLLINAGCIYSQQEDKGLVRGVVITYAQEQFS